MSNFEGGQVSAPARTAVQKSFGSTVYLVAAIVYAASLILDLATAQTKQEAVNEIVAAFSNSSGAGASSAISGMAGFLVRLPKILTLIGMVMAWKAAKDRESQNGTGFTVLQVAVYLTYIPTLLILGVSALLTVAFGKAVIGETFGEEAEAAAMRIALGIVVSMIFSLIYMIGLVKTYSGCGKVVKTLDGWKGASIVVIVFNIISILSSLFGLLIVSVTVKDVIAPYLADLGIDAEPIEKLFTGVSIMPGLLTVVYLILMTATFIKANSEYKKNR